MRILSLVFAGALATLAFPPFDLWPLLLLGQALLCWQWCGASARRAALQGWLYGAGFFATGLSWIYVSTHVYGGAPAWLAVFLIALLSAYLALYPALVGYLLRRLDSGRPAFNLLVLMPLLWCASELARGWVFTGFPWLSLGYVAGDLGGLGGWAALFGVHGLSLLVAVAAGAIVLAAQGGWRIALAALVALAVLSTLLPAPSFWTAPQASAARVALVQGNVPQNEKWRPENRAPTLQRYRELTATALDADLVIWPEVAVPAPYQVLPHYFSLIGEMAADADATVLIGAISREDEGTFNVMVAVGREPGRYTKRHLVPFGEYFPVPAIVRPVLVWLDLPYGDISTQRPAEPPLTLDGQPLGMSICFEDVFGDEVRRSSRDAVLLINVTNDAWFAGTAAPAQHQQIARLRAMENGRPLLRVANTGVSMHIDADGRVRTALAWGETGVLRTEVLPRTGLTPFQRWGHLPLFVLIAVGLGLGIRRRRRANPLT